MPRKRKIKWEFILYFLLINLYFPHLGDSICTRKGLRYAFYETEGVAF